MQTKTTKKLLQDNCERLRSQIEELEQRLRSSSMNRVAPGPSLPERSSIKRAERQSLVREQYSLFRECEQAKEEYESSLAKLTDDYQREKDRLKKNYEKRISEINQQQEEQSKTIVNVGRVPPRPNKENTLNTTNTEKSRGRIAGDNQYRQREVCARTPLGKSTALNHRAAISNSHLQYESSSEDESPVHQPHQRTACSVKPTAVRTKPVR